MQEQETITKRPMAYIGGISESEAAALRQHCESLQSKLTALTRSLQQIANLDPNNFNAANQAVQMAKTALLIPIQK